LVCYMVAVKLGHHVVFYYFYDYRGHHRKGIAIEVNLQNKKLWFHSTKMCF
jgi:hypothetical protein